MLKTIKNYLKNFSKNLKGRGKLKWKYDSMKTKNGIRNSKILKTLCLHLVSLCKQSQE